MEVRSSPAAGWPDFPSAGCLPVARQDGSRRSLLPSCQETGSRAGVWEEQDPITLGRVGNTPFGCLETNKALGLPFGSACLCLPALLKGIQRDFLVLEHHKYLWQLFWEKRPGDIYTLWMRHSDAWRIPDPVLALGFLGACSSPSPSAVVHTHRHS